MAEVRHPKEAVSECRALEASKNVTEEVREHHHCAATRTTR